MSAWWQYTLAMVVTLAVCAVYNRWRFTQHLAKITALAVRVERGAFVEYIETMVDADGGEWEHDCDRCASIAAFLVTVPNRQPSRVCARCLGPEVFDASQRPMPAQ